jgi:fatty acid desaturase
MRRRKKIDTEEVSAAPFDPSTVYPPLEEVRKKLIVQWYRCPLKPGRLTSHWMKRSDAQGLFQTLGHLLMWTFTGSMAYYCWAAQHWLLVPAALFAHGTVGSCFYYGVHELGHGTVFHTKWLNTFFLHVMSALAWWDPYDYASSHTYHHRYSQYPEGDRENLFPLVPSLDPWVMLELFTVNLTAGPGRVFGTGGLISTVKLRVKAALGGIASAPHAESHEWLTKLHADMPEQAHKSMLWNRVMVVFHLVVFLGAVVTKQWALIPIVNFHIFLANWYSYFVGETQHCGLRGSVPDFRKSARSITLDPFSEFLFWRMNWHVEHHMFAGVPCYNLKALHDEVAHDMPEPRTLIGAWKEMRETWFKQQVDPSYEYDTPLPATANPGGGKTVRVEDGKIADTALTKTDESSIGDLAPIGHGGVISADRSAAHDDVLSIDNLKVVRGRNQWGLDANGLVSKTGEVLGYAPAWRYRRTPITLAKDALAKGTSDDDSGDDVCLD